MTELIAIDSTINELMAMAEVPKEQLVKEMDRNYLASLVRDNPTLNKSDFVNFITKAQLTGADPRLNQIYLIVHNAWNSQKRVSEPKGTTIFAYQFFLQKAQQTGQLESLKVETKREPYLDLQTGRERNSVTTYCTIKRSGKAEIVYPARFWEFAKTDKDGNLSGNWKAAPYMMLEKCAVANACRWAFPETLSGMYISEEMEKATNEPVKVTQKPVQQQAPVQIPEQRSQPDVQNQAQSDEFMTIKDDLLEFISCRPASWFDTLRLDKPSMLAKVMDAATTEEILSMSKRAAEYDDKFRDLMSKKKRDLTAEMKNIQSEETSSDSV